MDGAFSLGEWMGIIGLAVALASLLGGFLFRIWRACEELVRMQRAAARNLPTREQSDKMLRLMQTQVKLLLRIMEEQKIDIPTTELLADDLAP